MSVKDEAEFVAGVITGKELLLREEIESLRAENKKLVAKYNRDMATAERLDDCHVKEIIEKDKRIEELERELKRYTELAIFGTWITNEQIDAMWEMAVANGPEGLWVLEEGGIVECDECEGVGVGVSEYCTNCGGKKWRMKDATEK